MRRRTLWRGGAVAVLATALAAIVVASVGPGAVAQQGAAPGPAEPVSVTLVSGDRVRLWGSGPSAPLRFEPAPRPHSVAYQDFWRNGDRYVIPDDAALLVSDETASYRVVADARQHDAGWPLSTVVTAEWAFRSSARVRARHCPC